MTSTTRLVVARRTAWPSLAVLTLALVGTGVHAVAAPAPGTTASGGRTDAAPAFFVDSTSAGERLDAPRSVAGSHRLVTLRTSALPQRAAAQEIGFDLGRGQAVVGRFDTVDHRPTYTAWAGSLENDPLGTFAIVRSGSVYRAEVISPTSGIHDVTQASGDSTGRHYWVTTVAPQTPQVRDDSASASAARPAPATAARHGRSRIDVMFAYTKLAKQTAGSKAQLKADAALVITQTNQTLENSGDKVVMRYRGLVRAHGTEKKNPIRDAFWVARPHDHHFDGLQKLRARHHADLIHLFVGGTTGYFDGGGLVPFEPSTAGPAVDASVSYVQDLPYLVATHELGHNLGADHIDYPGIGHTSKVPFAYGFYNVPGNYVTIMSYLTPCYDAGVDTCVTIPWFSSPTNTDGGQPLGSGKRTNNTKVVALTAPHVANYAH